MAKDSMAKLSGILILLSVFLPVRYLTYTEVFGNGTSFFEHYQWLFGLQYVVETQTKVIEGNMGRYVFTETWFAFSTNLIPGIIIALILVIMSILIISNANSGKGAKVKKKGIISIILLVVEFSWFYYAFVLAGYYDRLENFTLYPYIGFFGILIGGVLAMIGGNKLE